MNNRVEGTIVLDGMIEGKLPADAQSAQGVREWPKFAEKFGLHFNHESDGGSFTLLAHNQPIDARTVGPDPAEVITSALRELLKLFAPPERSGLFSTLRSVQYTKGEEIQTVYAISVTGVQMRQRTVDAPTTEAPLPVSRREKIRMGIFSGVALLVLFGISCFFVDYPKLFNTVKSQAASYQPNEVSVDVGPFGRYLSVDKPQIGSDGQTLIITLHRKGEFPLNDAQADAAATRPSTQPVLPAPNDTLSGRMTLEAVAGGYVRCESFGPDGKLQETRFVRIRDLRDHETVDVEIPMQRNPRTGKVVLGI